MDVKELIKFQMFSQGGSQISNQIILMVVMSVIDELVKHFAVFIEFIKKRWAAKMSDQLGQIGVSMESPITHDAVPLDKRHFTNTITMKRVWKDEGKYESFQETNSMIDAILALISRLDNVPSLQLIDNAKTLASYKDKPIQITKDIFVKIDGIGMNMDTGMVDFVKLVLMSNSLSAAEIGKWVRQMHDLHKEELKNALGDSIYYFDQKTRASDDPRGGSDEKLEKAMRIMSAPKNLTFSKTLFYSNKQFRNIFGKQVREVEHRVRFFLENREWYDSRGIPYQLGIMLSGIPGSGKTSIIRAIANHTKRHIVNVNFSNITTATQLKNLFFSEKLTILNGETSMTLNIPLNQRIYVLEEVDAVGDIVKQRQAADEKKEVIADELTLAEILTTLDGTLETPGRIIIMTSNHPDMLDKALIRPGRIDVSVKFGYADRELVVEMFEAFFEKEFPTELIPQLPDKVLTPAEVGQVLFRNFMHTDPQQVVDDLAATRPRPETPPSLPESPSSPEPSPESPPTLQEALACAKVLEDGTVVQPPKDEFPDLGQLVKVTSPNDIPSDTFQKGPAEIIYDFARDKTLLQTVPRGKIEGELMAANDDDDNYAEF